VHFSWLSTVYNWEKETDDFKSTYYVMYDIRECLECRRKYKDVLGFMGIGRGALRFYSNFADTGHPGYCSEYYAINSGTYVHPFDKLEDERADGNFTSFSYLKSQKKKEFGLSKSLYTPPKSAASLVSFGFLRTPENYCELKGSRSHGVYLEGQFLGCESERERREKDARLRKIAS